MIVTAWQRLDVGSRGHAFNTVHECVQVETARSPAGGLQGERLRGLELEPNTAVGCGIAAR